MVDQRKEALESIISDKQIKTVFQPIISLTDGNVLGHEALSRITCESIIRNPDMLFRTAGEFNRLWDLELLCRTKALEAAYIFMVPPYNRKLFLNVNPNIMHDDSFKKGFTKAFLEQYKIAPHNVIFEITERNVITDMTGFKATIDHYKGQNYKIAIDDAGAGYSGLNLISDVNPNYIKLDMNLIRNINKDNLKSALIRGMVELSKVSNIHLIAEGIETYEELEALINLGVQYGQGYYIQRPDIRLHEICPEILQAIQDINYKKIYASQSTLSNLSIKRLCTVIRTVPPDEMVYKVYDIMKRNQSCFGVCVIDNDVPVGIVTQEKLAFQLSGHYGFALFQNKPISSIMDCDYLSVDAKTPISLVNSMAMSRTNNRLYDFIVITEDNKYIGVVTIKDLLQKTTEMEVSAAKHQNPLTGLPGNKIINQVLSESVTGSSNFSAVYFDIDNFKAYNDVYGFENGDLIIRMLADILRCNISGDQFIGHIGGDDFLVVLNSHVEDSFFEPIKNMFCVEAQGFYNLADLKRGYITTTNRQGQPEQFSLLTLTAVVANNKDHDYKDVFELTEKLAYRKKKAKQKNKTCLICEGGTIIQSVI